MKNMNFLKVGFTDSLITWAKRIKGYDTSLPSRAQAASLAGTSGLLSNLNNESLIRDHLMKEIYESFKEDDADL